MWTISNKNGHCVEARCFLYQKRTLLFSTPALLGLISGWKDLILVWFYLKLPASLHCKQNSWIRNWLLTIAKGPFSCILAPKNWSFAKFLSFFNFIFFVSVSYVIGFFERTRENINQVFRDKVTIMRYHISKNNVLYNFSFLKLSNVKLFIYLYKEYTEDV